MEKFKDKICFITGGANGIGKAIVKAFHQEGATVIFCDIDTQAGEKIASNEKNIHFYPVDIKNANLLSETINSVFKKFGSIDILINNAGISKFTPLTENSIQEFDTILATNLRPVFITSQLLAKERNTPEKKKQYGRIINIASTRYLQSEPHSEAYAATKGGIVSLTHALALSLEDYNITVNCISPGWIQNENYKELKPSDHLQHPSGRVGMPEDIARACLFLANPENDFINGQNIVIDGGMTKKMIYLD